VARAPAPWARGTGRTDRDLTRGLADLARQPLAPGLRVAEPVGLTRERVALRERSGWADVVGQRGEHRRVPLDAAARAALAALRPDGERPSGPVLGGAAFGRRVLIERSPTTLCHAA
jgi:integrase